MGTSCKLKSVINVLSDLGGKCRHATVKSSKYNINHRKNLKDKAEGNTPFDARQLPVLRNGSGRNVRDILSETQDYRRLKNRP